MQFGSVIGFANGTTFMLQTGNYLVQLSVPAVFLEFPATTTGTGSISIGVEVNGNSSGRTITGTGPISSGVFPSEGVVYVPMNVNELLQISGPNTVVGFTVSFSATAASLTDGCRIIFTRLQ